MLYAIFIILLCVAVAFLFYRKRVPKARMLVSPDEAKKLIDDVEVLSVISELWDLDCEAEDLRNATQTIEQADFKKHLLQREQTTSKMRDALTRLENAAHGMKSQSMQNFCKNQIEHFQLSLKLQLLISNPKEASKNQIQVKQLAVILFRKKEAALKEFEQVSKDIQSVMSVM